MLKTEIVYILPKAFDREGMSFKVKVSDNTEKGLPSFMKFENLKGESSLSIAPETKQ